MFSVKLVLDAEFIGVKITMMSISYYLSAEKSATVQLINYSTATLVANNKSGAAKSS